MDGKEIYIPPFIRRNPLLPHNWIDLLQDRKQLEKTVWNWNSTQSKYSVKSGVALETTVNKLLNKWVYTSKKGPVAIVDDKEVDIAIRGLPEGWHDDAPRNGMSNQRVRKTV